MVNARKVDYKCFSKKGDIMFTVPSSRRIDTHLKYTVKVINVTAVNCMQNAITYSQVNHLDECVAAIEEYRERYLSKNHDYALS